MSVGKGHHKFNLESLVSETIQTLPDRVPQIAMLICNSAACPFDNSIPCAPECTAAGTRLFKYS